MEAKTIVKYKKVLLEEKQRILNNSKQSIENDISISVDDLADETDLAVSEVNQNLVFKLRDRERMMLQKINEALARMDEGTFGVCGECEENIEPKRLEARPVSTMCLSCQEQQEKKDKIYA